jgi:threonine dehydrogenase-like Zn-dependent dehydrogenase
MGPNNMQVREVPDPKILNRRDCIVKVTSTAICGSDLHLYNGFLPLMEPGDILGHEFMGEVVEVGPACTTSRSATASSSRSRSRAATARRARRGDLAVRELEPERAHRREAARPHVVRIFGYSHLTGGSPAGRRSTCACRSPTSARCRCPRDLTTSRCSS